MSSQFAHLDGRRFVNEDFVNEVRNLYPATTWKMPLGFRTYTGWTGKDEVLFTEHDPVGGLEGKVFEVTIDPANPAAFEEMILPQVKHSTKTAQLEAPVVAPEMSKEARSTSGLYGYPRSIQGACELAAKRLNRTASRLVKAAVKRDEAVLSFLVAHAKRAKSSSARVLLAAFRGSLPKLEWDETHDKQAAAAHYGMYGYPVKTGRIALAACASIREAAGVLAAQLHRRQSEFHPKITGFFMDHAKMAHCKASHLLFSCYPEPDFKFRRRASMPPTTIDGWLSLNLDSIE